MNATLEGRVALVTGGSSGIGKAAALALGEAGANVCVNGLSHMADAEQVAHEISKIGPKALAVRADVSRTDEVERLVSTTIKEFGHVDILFNNAGILQLATLGRRPTSYGGGIWRRTSRAPSCALGGWCLR